MYDGYDRLANEIHALTGSTPTALVSTGPAIFMSFATDHSITQLGFRVKYQASKYESYYKINYVIGTYNALNIY